MKRLAGSLVLILAGCGGPEGLRNVDPAAAQVPPSVELIRLGNIPPSASMAHAVAQDVITTPYERPVTEASEMLRKMALRAQEMEARDPARAYLMHVDLATGDVYAAAHDKAEASAIAARLAPDGVAPSSGNGVPVIGQATRGLSNNTDNRIYIGGSNYDNDSLATKVGRLWSDLGGCTATMFSRQHIFTGAHCVWGPNGWADPYTFRPRQHGANGSIAPYGAGTGNYLQFPTAWASNNCHVSYGEPCVRYDFAVVGFPSNAFSPNPGYVAFGWRSDAALLDLQFVQNIGYPSCAADKMPPPSCQAENPYKDIFCAFETVDLSEGSTSNAWPFSDGTNPHMKTACDATPGHSGGPVFDPYGVLIGNSVWNECWKGSCTANTIYSSGGIRINSTLFNWMMVYRNQAP